MLIINPASDWTTLQKMIGSGLLWHLIINWSGILESKRWLLMSEITRILLTVPVLILFTNLMDKPVWMAISIVYHFYCMIWTARFFRSKS
jgi:alkylglycerol monooxygenase